MPSQTPLGLALRRKKWHIEIMKRLQTPYWSALVLAALCSCSSAVGDDTGGETMSSQATSSSNALSSITGSSSSQAATSGDILGSATISLTTKSQGGSYAPKHVLAVWVSDGSKAVRQLGAAGTKEYKVLNTWISEGGSIDGVTSATRTAFGTTQYSWDGTDDNGNALPQGDYIVKAQVADGNTNRNTVTLPVTLGSASVSQSTSGTGVSALGIEYSP